MYNTTQLKRWNNLYFPRNFHLQQGSTNYQIYIRDMEGREPHKPMLLSSFQKISLIVMTVLYQFTATQPDYERYLTALNTGTRWLKLNFSTPLAIPNKPQLCQMIPMPLLLYYMHYVLLANPVRTSKFNFISKICRADLGDLNLSCSGKPAGTVLFSPRKTATKNNTTVLKEDVTNIQISF